MKLRFRRRSLATLLPVAFGGSALAASCRGPTLAAPATRATEPPFALARRNLGTRGSAKLEYANLPAGGSLTLLDLKLGSGYVSHLWVALSCADPLGLERTRYQIYVDGEATPSVNSTLVGFHAADDSPNTNFATRFIGYNQGDLGRSYYSYIPIPFRSSVKIDIVNGSASAAATLFAIADYQTGLTWNWGRMAKLHTFEQEASVAPYAWYDLLRVAAQPSGVLWGVYLWLRGGGTGFGFLEGNVQIFNNGAATPCYESSGTEDYFNNAWYFQTCLIFAEQSGCTKYDPKGYAVGAYRFHLDDPVPFERALQVRWQNGAVEQGKVVNPTALRSHVWYYTSS